MGFFDKLFGGGSKYPSLEDDNPAAQKIESMLSPLEELTSQVSDPMEVVPADDSCFVFIGNPKKELGFGLAWIEEGEIYNLKTLKEKGATQSELVKMMDALHEAYAKSLENERYSADIGGKKITVTPAEDLAREVKQIVSMR